jgi:hypothetical protein
MNKRAEVDKPHFISSSLIAPKERRFSNCPICGLAFLFLRSQKIFCIALATEMIFCAREGKIRRPKSDSY